MPLPGRQRRSGGEGVGAGRATRGLKVLGHIVTQVIAQHLGAPLVGVEQPLHAVRSVIADRFRDRPAVLAGQRGQQPQQVAAGSPARLPWSKFGQSWREYSKCAPCVRVVKAERSLPYLHHFLQQPTRTGAVTKSYQHSAEVHHPLESCRVLKAECPFPGLDGLLEHATCGLQFTEFGHDDCEGIDRSEREEMLVAQRLALRVQFLLLQATAERAE
jgi:hypothetical protein